jgi:hypothetical protein
VLISLCPSRLMRRFDFLRGAARRLMQINADTPPPEAHIAWSKWEGAMRAMSPIHGLAEAVSGALRRWRDWRERRTELLYCDPSEVERMARELGLCPSELAALARTGPDAAALSERRLLAMGIYPSAVRTSEPLVMQDLQRCCSICDSKRRCQRDLDERSKSSDWLKYCPNAATLTAL